MSNISYEYFREKISYDNKMYPGPLTLLKKTTLSDSDIFFGKIVNVENKDQIEIAIKVFPSIQNEVKYKGESNRRFEEREKELKKGIECMLYEGLTYKEVSDNILDKKLSPCFVRLIEAFSMDVNIMENNEECSKESPNIENLFLSPQIFKFIHSNFVVKDEKGDPIFDYPNGENNIVNLNFLCTEKIGNGYNFSAKGVENKVVRIYNKLEKFFTVSTSYCKCCKKNKHLNVNIPEATYEQKCVIFQLLFALKSLKDNFICHNDLHGGNIFICEYENPIYFKYEGLSKPCYFSTKHVPFIFDWNYSYCKKNGPNPFLIGNMEDELQISNKFIPKRDLYTIACVLDFNKELFGDYWLDSALRELETCYPIPDELKHLNPGNVFLIEDRNYLDLLNLKNYSKAYIKIIKRKGYLFYQVLKTYDCRLTLEFDNKIPNVEDIMESIYVPMFSNINPQDWGKNVYINTYKTFNMMRYY